MVVSSCPTEDVLRSFSSGTLDDGSLDAVVDHVSDCPTCETALERFDAETDPFLQSLQRGSHDAVAVELAANIPASVNAALRQIGQPGESGLGSSVTTDPGRRYARLLADGPVMIGRFELLGELGTGSFGYVFRAHDTGLDRIVALKLQRAGNMASDEDVARFLREARSVAQLSHPGIVSLFESGQTEDSVCYLVTEFVEGRTLEECVNDHFEPNWRTLAEQVARLADSLDYAHQHGVIHRDIKPSNVLIDSAGRPHVMDFGLALRETGDATLTSDGRIMGTPAYMSPEQARGDSHLVDARTDVYSLGVVMYELLTGERPFQGNRRMLLLQVLEDDPRPPRQLNDTVPRDLETICLKAMSRNSARRYQSARELADDLRRYLNGEHVHARPVNSMERFWRWCSRYPFAAMLFVALVVGSAAGFAHLSHLSTWFVHSTALESVRMDATMLEEINKFYSDVVGRLKLKDTGVHVTHEYLITDNALPLPATFTIDAGQRISQSECGLQVRMYSRYPWRKDAGAKTGFEKQALDVLEQRIAEQNTDLTWHEFRTEADQSWLYFAKAQIMQESCVKCHNGHKLSPRRDWKQGDLAGVLLLSRPLDRDIAVTRDGLRGAFNLMGSIVIALGALGMAFVVRNRVSSSNRYGKSDS